MVYVRFMLLLAVWELSHHGLIWNQKTILFHYNVKNGNFDGNSGCLILTAPQQLTSYTMTVNGVTYSASTLSSARLEGQLIKPWLSPLPISAVSGKFEFQHGSNAGSRGVFRADLM